MHQPTTDTIYHMIVPPPLKRQPTAKWPWLLVGVVAGIFLGSLL